MWGRCQIADSDSESGLKPPDDALFEQPRIADASPAPTPLEGGVETSGRAYDPPQSASKVLKIIAFVVPVLVFGFLSGFAFWISGRTAPPKEDLSMMPAVFEVYVPPLSVGDSQVPPKILYYAEVHTPNMVVITIILKYDQRTAGIQQGPRNINLLLPETGSKVVGDCSITWSVEKWCHVGPAENGRDALYIGFEPVSDFEGSLTATAELSDISGIGFKTTAWRTQVRFPGFRVFGDPNPVDLTVPEEPTPADLPLDVSASYQIADPDRYEWGSPAPRIIHYTEPSGDPGVASVWRYSNENIPSPVVGLRQDVLDDNSRKNFIAGIWVGIGGGALVALLEAVLAVAFTRRN